MRPPKRACVELDGRPRYQVPRFQSTAPTSPAKIIVGVICTPPSPSLMMPCEMVFATSVERKAPTRLSTAEMVTATFGLSAPVATEVAMAFAVSWKRFVRRSRATVRPAG
jgi:hypothetical protein